MKVLCPHCERLITLEFFRVEGGALIITCSKCSAESRVENVAEAVAQQHVSQSGGSPARPPSLPPRVSLASTDGGSNVVVLRTAGHEAVQKAAKAAEANPFTAPDTVCPKCIAPRATSASCPHCGILFESLDEAELLPPKWVRDEWVELLRDWSNEPKHQQLRRKAQQADALAAIGRLYRMRQSAVPEDPIAEDGRTDVLRLAAVAISFRPVQDADVDQRKRVVIVAGLSVAIVILATFLIRMLLVEP